MPTLSPRASHRAALAAPARLSPRFYRLSLLTFACAMAFAAAGTSRTAHAQQATSPALASVRQVALPAQPLGQAINALAREWDVAISIDASLSNGKSAPAVQGSMTLSQALSRVLAGSGLVAVSSGSAVIIQRPSSAQGATTLPTVLVTAEGAVANSMNLQQPVASGTLGNRSQLDTPFSTTIVSSQEIENRQVTTLGSLFAGDASAVPAGATYSGRPNYLQVRGLRLDDSNGAKINGLPVVNYGVEMPYEQFERVELLKGLSGFMYGFGSPGGIVNFVTKKPPVGDKPVRSIDIGYTSDHVWSRHIDLGDRFGNDGRFGYRLNATHEEGTTYNNGKINRDSVSLGLDARLTPDLLWTFDGLYQKRRAEGTVYVNTSSFTGASLPSALNGRTNLTSSDNSPNKTEFYMMSTGLQYSINADWKISTNYSYTRTKKRYQEDYLYLLTEGGDYRESVFDWANNFGFHQMQVMADGKVRTGPIEHQLVFGAQRISQYTDTASNGSFGSIGTGNLYDDNTNVYNVTRIPQTYRAIDIRQNVLFASDTVKFNDQWSLIAGGRYTDYQQKGRNKAGDVTSTYTKNQVFTPTLALMYKPLATTTIYGSYVESLEAGTIVSPIYTNANSVLSPLKSKQYEFGVKTEQDDWSATAALFRIERGAAYVTPDNTYVQDGRVRFQGLELGSIGKLTRAWTAGANLMLLDSEYRRTASLQEGNRVAAAPRYVVALQTSYDIGAVPGLSVGMDGKYIGRSNLKSNGTLPMPSFWVFNAGASYHTRVSSYPVTLRLAVDNIANKRYWYAQGEDGLLIGTPRTVSLNAKIEF
ncbi:TonB-dependent siderophore receptor [Bordetella genomosp. 10]|nr:TonB-dependent receptor [Bordetella genomosp. 10]